MRRDARYLTPQQIAEHGSKANLNTGDTLRLISAYSQRRFQMTSSPLPDAVASFVSSLCIMSHCKRVLEYTVADTLLTEQLLTKKTEVHLTFVSRNADFAEALHRVLPETNSSVFSDVPSVAANLTYDAIICSPPIGSRPPDQNGDGFGSDVIRALGPFLATNGTLCWVTGRGVLFNRHSAKIFASLADAGLHVAAIIDLAPGTLSGAAIAGLLVALRRKANVPCMDGARGAREKSGISAKRSGAAMYSAFECSRFGRWP